jgi:hypothetical protein
VRLIDGREVGEIEVLPIHHGVPFSLLGIAATGDVYYYAFPNPPLTLYVAPFDAATQHVGSPTPVIDLPSLPNMDWSPDSQSIAYASWNPAKNIPRIAIRNIQTAVEREIDLPIAGRIWSLRWSPYAGILVSSGNQFQTQLQLVSLDDMSVKPLQIWARWGIAEWAADGWMAVVAGQGNVREVDVTTGKVNKIHKVPIDTIMRISPTQKLVASRNHVNGVFEVQVAAFDESMSRTLLSSGRDCHPAGFWRRQLFVACQDNSDQPDSSSLYLVDIDSGTMTGLDVTLPTITQVRVRPDNQAIAITSGIRTFGKAFSLKIPAR